MSDQASYQPPGTPTPNVGEALARPKVLRRPAQFSKTYTPSRLPISSTPNLALADPHPITPTPRLWQDDGRFAITLLILVILVNLLVTSWLSTMKPTTGDAPIAFGPIISGTDVTPDDGTTVHILNESADLESDQ